MLTKNFTLKELCRKSYDKHINQDMEYYIYGQRSRL